jgi:endonuclease IV
MIAYCDWKYTFHGTSQMTNKTVGKNNDQHIASNDVDDNNNLRNELIKDAKMFERKMIGWLQDNRENIPEYCDTPTDKIHQSLRPAKSTGNYLGNFIIT